MSQRFIAVCQWCGARGGTTTSNSNQPSYAPKVPGKCKSHPSGNPNMEHGARWEKY